MIRLITSSPRRFGLGLTTASRLMTTFTPDTTTTTTTTTTNPDNGKSNDPPTKFDFGEYMKQATASFQNSPSTKILVDELSRRPSDRLAVALMDYLPTICHPRHNGIPIHPLIKTHNGKSIETATLPRPVPPGHHLVYFSELAAASQLMDDGAEEEFCPGPPFVRRLWVGGSVIFRHAWSRVALDGRPFHCVQTRSPPLVKNRLVGKESVSVTIRRTYSLGPPPQSAELIRNIDSRVMVETRKLLFLRREPRSLGNVIKRRSPRGWFDAPDWSFELTPDNALLFRFSALTDNAHAIHLNPEYAKNVEGYRDLLVHGPLTLVLMLSALQAQCNLSEEATKKEICIPNQKWVIKWISYHNLLPLYVGEKLKVCVKLLKEYTFNHKLCGPVPHQKRWRVWIENSEGHVAVVGKALIEQADLTSMKRETERGIEGIVADSDEFDEEGEGIIEKEEEEEGKEAGHEQEQEAHEEEEGENEEQQKKQEQEQLETLKLAEQLLQQARERIKSGSS